MDKHPSKTIVDERQLFSQNYELSLDHLLQELSLQGITPSDYGYITISSEDNCVYDEYNSPTTTVTYRKETENPNYEQELATWECLQRKYRKEHEDYLAGEELRARQEAAVRKNRADLKRLHRVSRLERNIEGLRQSGNNPSLLTFLEAQLKEISNGSL